jgi:hypothetical protein
MEGFTKTPPKPRPVEYSRSFTKDEIETALKFYLEQHGVPVPKGSTSLCIHRRESNAHDEEDRKAISLTIEVFE